MPAIQDPFPIQSPSMLTTQELEKLKQLIAGKRQPSDGMETHFLRVINGDALPCSPREREWYQYWQQETGTIEDADDYREPHHETIAALRQRDAIILSLQEQIGRLNREKEAANEKNALLLREKDSSIDVLRKEVALLETFLKNAHKTLQKYEPLQAPLVTDVQAVNERKIRDAERQAQQHFTKEIYSSTDGQE